MTSGGTLTKYLLTSRSVLKQLSTNSSFFFLFKNGIKLKKWDQTKKNGIKLKNGQLTLWAQFLGGAFLCPYSSFFWARGNFAWAGYK